MSGLYAKLRKLVEREEGQGMVEYAMIIGLIAVGLVLAMGLMGDSLEALFGRITATLNSFIPGQ